MIFLARTSLVLCIAAVISVATGCVSEPCADNPSFTPQMQALGLPKVDGAKPCAAGTADFASFVHDKDRLAVLDAYLDGFKKVGWTETGVPAGSKDSDPGAHYFSKDGRTVRFSTESCMYPGWAFWMGPCAIAQFDAKP